MIIIKEPACNTVFTNSLIIIAQLAGEDERVCLNVTNIVIFLQLVKFSEYDEGITNDDANWVDLMQIYIHTLHATHFRQKSNRVSSVEREKREGFILFRRCVLFTCQHE
jgi:hypothetical protein